MPPGKEVLFMTRLVEPLRADALFPLMATAMTEDGGVGVPADRSEGEYDPREFSAAVRP